MFVRGFDHVYVGVDYFAKTIVFLYKSVKAIELITFLKDDFILFYFNRFAYLFKRGLSYNCNLKKKCDSINRFTVPCTQTMQAITKIANHQIKVVNNSKVTRMFKD